MRYIRLYAARPAQRATCAAERLTLTLILPLPLTLPLPLPLTLTLTTDPDQATEEEAERGLQASTYYGYSYYGSAYYGQAEPHHGPAHREALPRYLSMT